MVFRAEGDQLAIFSGEGCTHMRSIDIKELARASGAALCGIADAAGFTGAEEGFRPVDIYPDAKSVVVFAIRLPEGVFHSRSTIPYTSMNDVALREILRVSSVISLALADARLVAVPVPSEPYEYWDRDALRGKGLISLKYAGFLAGLGVIGRNTLLCNERYGSLLKLGAVLVNAAFELDVPVEHDLGCESCGACERSCPSRAIGGGSVAQGSCRPASEGKTAKGAEIVTCFRCMAVCPRRGGWASAV